MKAVNIEQSIVIEASCAEVYELLMIAKKHAELTSGKAIVEDRVGSTFSFFDGYITGTNLELVKDKLIIQEWRAQEDAWPDNHYSIVTIELNEAELGTRINFTHEKLPADLADSIAKGWFEYYWQPMMHYFADRK